MIYLRWIILALVDWIMWLTVWPVATVVAALTREQPYGLAPYSWGWLWGTYDNPPQGDRGFVTKRCWFLGITTGFKGYLNRVNWMTRNPLYGLAKRMSLPYKADNVLSYVGNPDISDKDGRPGYYFAKLHDKDKLVGFEFYGVFPWSKTRDARIRFGWKLMTDKFERMGFAPLVNTFNPVDGYNQG